MDFSFSSLELLHCGENDEDFVYNHSKESAILHQEKHVLKFSRVSAETNNQIQNNFSLRDAIPGLECNKSLPEAQRISQETLPGVWISCAQ